MKRSSAVLIPAALVVAWGATRVGRLARAESPPGGEPALFAPGVVSSPLDETGVSFTPDGGTAYFARRSPTTTSTPVQAIFVSRRAGAGWTPPEIVPFSGRWPDFSPSVSPDGERIFFSSLRPRAGASETRPDADIWVVERAAGGGWSDPRVLDAPVNSDNNDAYACQAADRTLYFASDRPGGAGGTDIYRAAKMSNGSGWAAPENLGAGVNTPGYESQPAVAPDQAFLVFTALGRPDIPLTGGSPYARGDLYVSVRRDGAFQAARNLGPPVNSTATDSNPSIGPGGKRLFFTSERGFAKIPMDAGLTREGFERTMRGILNSRGNIYEIPLARIGLPEGGGHP